MFIFSSIIFTLTCGVLMACIFTNDMPTTPKKIIKFFAIAVGFGVLAGGGFALDHKANTDEWNCGRCHQCGYEYHLFTTEKGLHSTTYYYKCRNDHVITTTEYFER